MAITNLEKYKKDLASLIDEGANVYNSLLYSIETTKYRQAILEGFGGDVEKTKNHIESLPSFADGYQHWYSEAVTVVKQLLPDRLADFVRLYEKPRARKEITFENYRIEDAIQGLRVTRGDVVKVDKTAALSLVEAQLSIVKSINKRFSSTLFDIRQLVQADLFDSELDAARELLKNKFTRGAGAIAGVVLEKHLSQVCNNHQVNITKKHPSISDFNDALKNSGVIDVAQWRFHQHLGDIRNNCDHSKGAEPTHDQVNDLIEGVSKVSKTIF